MTTKVERPFITHIYLEWPANHWVYSKVYIVTVHHIVPAILFTITPGPSYPPQFVLRNISTTTSRKIF